MKTYYCTMLSKLRFRLPGHMLMPYTQSQVVGQGRLIYTHQKSTQWELESKVKVTSQTAKQTPPLSLPDFEDHKEAYKSKSMSKLLRAFILFQLCSFDSLVDRQLMILKWCRRILGKRLFVWTMRKSLYEHFMGGDTRQEVLKQVEHNVKYGVQPMIAFTASESHGDTGTSDANSATKQKFHADCLVADMDSLQYAHGMRDLSTAVPLVSGKLTFIQPHQIFTSASALIKQNREFIQMCQQAKTGHTETREFEAMVTECISQNNSKACLQSASMSMDFHLQLYQNGYPHFPMYREVMNDIKVDIDGIKITAEVMRTLGQRAEDLGVVLIWDAEQTYLQIAMDVFILDSMRCHNKDRAVVHGTYQCYLKETFDKVIRDTDLAAQEGFCWGGKVVRGGYMDEERRLASVDGFEDPVNPTYEATTDMYHKVVEKILVLMTEREEREINVTVATHNVDTVRYIINRMIQMEFTPKGNFRFAQLLGMRDNITFCLGQSGLPVAKLVHYGPVEDCVAYVSRRVIENRSGIATANYERNMLKREILSRVKGK